MNIIFYCTVAHNYNYKCSYTNRKLQICHFFPPTISGSGGEQPEKITNTPEKKWAKRKKEEHTHTQREIENNSHKKVLKYSKNSSDIAQFELINDTNTPRNWRTAAPRTAALAGVPATVRPSFCASVRSFVERLLQNCCGIRGMQRGTRAAILRAQQPEMKKNSSRNVHRKGKRSEEMAKKQTVLQTGHTDRETGFFHTLIDDKLWVKNLNCPRNTLRLKLICNRDVEEMTLASLTRKDYDQSSHRCSISAQVLDANRHTPLSGLICYALKYVTFCLLRYIYAPLWAFSASPCHMIYFEKE
ncbi:unnamed protein product [Ceratitis capitata]|uniref:(Mediterranean fruit fly) hypothetical protein n=1 Tax=Ceratitis capitata TaxID=7213 RepID=A0A811V960_CERCA|nr:unnamed protein product [Ceratitis capitata]